MYCDKGELISMNPTNIFIDILKSAMTQTSYETTTTIDQEGWERIYDISQKQQLAPLIYQQIFSNESFQQSDIEFQNFWKMDTINQAGNQARKSVLFLTLFDKMRKQGLTALVVKGIICRNLYKDPDLRISNDEDLFIPRDQFEKMDQFLLGEGFMRDELIEGKVYQEVPYKNPRNGLYFELHMDLFPKESGAYGHFNDLFEDAFDHCVEVDIQGSKILTLNPGQHFLYLVCHSLKHFLHSGFGIRQACDILYFAKYYHDQFDWDQIKKIMREYHMETFAMNILDIGVCYLGFTWEEMGLSKPSDMEIDCTPLLDDMLDGGIFGQNDMNRVHSANITLNAAEYESANAMSGIFASLFPEKEYIKTNYPYARKLPILLPVAYLHRIFKYLSGRKEEKQDTGEKSSTQIGMERVKLLEKYKIVDK